MRAWSSIGDPLRHAGIDVGDRHAHERRAVAAGFGGAELIEIARVVVVDRAPEQAGEVAQIAVDRRRVRNLLCLRQRRRREVGLEAALVHGAAGDRTESGSGGGGVVGHAQQFTGSSTKSHPRRDRPALIAGPAAVIHSTTA